MIPTWGDAQESAKLLANNDLKPAFVWPSQPPLSKVLRRPFESAQYACGDDRKMLRFHGMKASMSRKGNCLDNAPMESFFGSLKTERVHRTRFATRREARAALFEYIKIFYNRQQRHSSIGYPTPVQASIDITVAKAA